MKQKQKDKGRLFSQIGDIARRDYGRVHTVETPIPFQIILGVLIAGLVLEVLVIALIISLGLLPVKFVVMIIVIILAADAGIIALIANRNRGIKRFYTGMILLVVVMMLLLPTAYFLQTTGSALKQISTMRDQYEEYDVIALKDGSYKGLEDIKGKEVHCINSKAKMNEEANERLITAADVMIKEDSDIMSLASKLVDDKGNLHDNIIFTSKSYYEMQCEEIEDFKKNTDVIYTMQVMKRSSSNGRRVNVTKDPFNVYVTGLDTWGSIDKVSRSDVNMIVTINPQTREVLLTAIPRDAYVELHSFEQMDKLTHSGIYGVDETLSTVEDWLDVELDYYVKVNFSMVVRLIDAVGDIEVYSDKEFDSAVSKYHYKKGWNKMHGKQALFFARERKSFEKGDAERIKNQQKVMEALIKKVTNSRVVLTHYSDVLDAISENMITNMNQREISALARMQLRDMDRKWTIKTNNIKCTEASRGTYSMGMGRELYVNIPDEDSVKEANKKIHDIMYPAQVEEEKPTLIP